MTTPSTALVALAAFCWGLSGGIGGMLISDGWDPLVVSFYRGAIGLLFVGVWLALLPSESGLGSARLWFWSAVAGLGVAGNFAFYFQSIAQGSVAVAVTLMYSAPVFVYLLSFARKLERPTPLKWAAIVVVMLGLVLLTRIHEVRAAGISPIGVGAGLLAGLCYAAFIFAFRNASSHGSPQAVLVIAFAVLASILVWAADSDQAVAVLASPSWPLFAALGTLGAGMSFILYVVGLNYTAPAVASIVAMIEPVTASLFGVLVLNESLTGLQVFGMGLILVMVAVLGVNSAASRPCARLERSTRLK